MDQLLRHLLLYDCRYYTPIIYSQILDVFNLQNHVFFVLILLRYKHPYINLMNKRNDKIKFSLY